MNAEQPEPNQSGPRPAAEDPAPESAQAELAEPVASASIAPSEESDRRSRKVLAIVIGAYVFAIVMLVVLDQVAVVWKSLVVPGMALAAALSGRLREFVRDWAVFLASVVLFDASRGFVYALIARFELPVYMGYAIHLEKAIFGNPLLTNQVQHLLTPDGKATLFDRVLAVVYGSHFVLFLLYGLALWMIRPRDFGRFKVSMLLIMYLGVLGYLLIPTVPPWMAASMYYVIPPILELGAQIFHSALPTITTAFEINPIAAMPSLHCAFPTLITLITFRHFKHWGWPMLGYSCLVYLSTVQLGHHYGVDVLAGITLALVVYGLIYGTDVIAGWFGSLREPKSDRVALRRRLLATGLLLSLTLAEGVYGPLIQGPEPIPTEAFINHELEGKSPMAAYYRGKLAFRKGDFKLAQHWLAASLPDIPSKNERLSALGDLAITAYFNRDYRTVVWAARRFGKGFPAGLGLMIAESLVRTGEQEEGFKLLDQIAAAQPNQPEVKALQAELAPMRPDHGS